MVVHHTCKNEENPIKNEGARVLTRLYVFFSYAQGLRSQRWNSAEIQTHPRMKKIQSKMKELEC